MEVKPGTTVADLMKRFPRGFSVGPGTPEQPGCLSRLLMASSHLSAIVNFGSIEGNQGYMIVDMDEQPEG